MYRIFIYVFLFCLPALVYSKTIVIDKNGLGDYTTIMQGINAASAGDTVRVNPGTYNEKVVLNKNIVVQGSGAETTLISNLNADYALEIYDGKIMWFAFTSLGTGIYAKGGILTNCVVKNCSSTGLECYTGVKILNCISYKNVVYGFYLPGGNQPIIINCISFQNTSWGLRVDDDQSYNVLYCNLAQNGGLNFGAPCCYYYVNQSIGSISVDPNFQSGTYQIGTSSGCKDAGHPGLRDPDGSPSDMGYYGGPDAPQFPMVKDIMIKLNQDGTVNLEATGISPY